MGPAPITTTTSAGPTRCARRHAGRRRSARPARQARSHARQRMAEIDARGHELPIAAVARETVLVVPGAQVGAAGQAGPARATETMAFDDDARADLQVRGISGHSATTPDHSWPGTTGNGRMRRRACRGSIRGRSRRSRPPRPARAPRPGQASARDVDEPRIAGPLHAKSTHGAALWPSATLLRASVRLAGPS